MTSETRSQPSQGSHISPLQAHM